MTEQANFSELRDKISNWDLEAEEMLINKLNIFTNSYKNDFAVFTKNMENLNNNLLNTEVEQYKAISNLKDISQNRFIEEKLEENAESVSEESDRGLEMGSGKEIFLDNNEKMKKVAEISIKNMEEINLKKEKNKEKIEDDSVSVASKNLVLENSKKYGKLPFIIGTSDFMKDKRIGLTNEIDEDDKQDESDEPEINREILEDRVVTAKMQKQWDKVEQKRKIKKAQKEKAKLQNSQMNENNKTPENNNKNNFNEEVKEQVDIPIDFEIIESVEVDGKNNNTNNNNKSNNDNITNNNNSNNNNIAISTGKGPGIPPPPPPPPKPVFNPANIKPKKKIEKKESSNTNINNTNNTQPVNINNNIPKNIPKNIPNIIPSNIPTNIPTNIPNNIPKNNPSIIPNNNNNINMFKPKMIQSVNPLLLQGLMNLRDDDDDDDEDIFSKKNRKMPVLNNNIIVAQSQNPVITPQTNIIANNNMKVNKMKLNNIFEGIENDDDEEEQKVEEKKNNVVEPIKNNQGIFSSENNEEQKNENEKKDNFDNQVKNNYPLKQNMKFNNLFDNQEEEKNNNENVEVKKPQTNINVKKKLTLFFGDDDD